ncbi:MAG TPA: hypothetical protein VMV46_11635, partial [Thermoanaerobaculia bacterium]|nr:hypothetical protein [Thermoanaerobaculia bacterium]
MTEEPRDRPTDPFRAWADFLAGSPGGGDAAPGADRAGGRGAADLQQAAWLMWRSAAEMLRLWTALLGATAQAAGDPRFAPW